MDRAILVSADLAGTPQPVGRLWARTRKGTETATFEYDHRWLGSRDAFSLEPALTLGPGPHHTPTGKALFGAIGDSAPDRWGRLLMRRDKSGNRVDYVYSARQNGSPTCGMSSGVRPMPMSATLKSTCVPRSSTDT